MALEIVREHAHRARRAAHLLERAAQLLDLRGVRLDEIAGVVERAAASLTSVPRRAHQRLIEVGDRLAQVVADLLEAASC